jgi:DNA-binding transcriptional ArsR family regulator
VAGTSQPAVSQHLRVLLEARLVQVEPQGTRRIYSLNPDGLAELRAYVEAAWEGVLKSFQDAANRKAAETAQEEENE